MFHVTSISVEALILLIRTENAVTGKLSSFLNYRVCHPYLELLVPAGLSSCSAMADNAVKAKSKL